MDTSNIVQKLQDTDLAPYAEALAAIAQPAIGITIEDTSDALPTGTSKFGGLPDLPTNTAWPKKEGKALNFLAQIRLADVKAQDEEHLLPTSGLLSFFYDADEQPYGAKEQFGGWRVLYFAEGTPLAVAAAPDNLISDGDGGVTEQHAIGFTPKATWPVWDDPAYKTLNLTEEARETFHTEKVQEVFYDINSLLEQTDSHLLGLAASVQGDVRAECQEWANGLTYEEAKAQGLLDRRDDWQLLLQLDSDESMNWMWGDVGSIYFMIRREDLQARRFENAWLIMQCG